MESIEVWLKYIFLIVLFVLGIWLFYLTVNLEIAGLNIGKNGELVKDDFPISVVLLNKIMSFSTQSELVRAISQITFFISVALAILTTIYSFVRSETIKKHVANYKSTIPITVEPINSKGEDDLAIMSKYYRDAEQVHVFAGDFSWLIDNEEIGNIVEQLVSQQRISFFSSKSRSVVANSLGEEKFRNYLPYFRFGEKTGFKASLVHMQGGAQYLLYNKIEADDKNDIIIFENKDTLNEPLTRLSNLVQEVEVPPFLILVCGETGAGKSVISKMLESNSRAQVISVGKLFKQYTSISGKKTYKRNDVIAIGKKYLDEFGAKALADNIIGLIDQTRNVVVVDGLRPLASINILKEKFPKHIMIYVDASEEIRNSRIDDIDLAELDQSIDEMVREARYDPSSIKIDNSLESIPEFEEIIEKEIFEKYLFLREA